jgi:hypothetical protein
MKYADTLRVMLDCYPSLFVDEADVLHHLFFVNGNGYDWEGGELVARDDDGVAADEAIRRKRARTLRELRTALDRLGASETFYRTEIARHEAGPEVEREAERENRRHMIERGRAGDVYFHLPDGRIGRKLYPLWEKSDILLVPFDVKPDWLEAAERAVALAKSNLFRRTALDDELLFRAEQRLCFIHAGL